MSKKTIKKKIIGEKPLPFEIGDKVKCIARKKIRSDTYNYMDGPAVGESIKLDKIYTVGYVGHYNTGESIVVLKGKNNYAHLTSNFKKVRTVKK